jgi:hypothetical protein
MAKLRAIETTTLRLGLWLLMLLLTAVLARPAHALPAYAAQTGQGFPYTTSDLVPAPGTSISTAP